MNPPLREEEDCEAIIEGICDGTIDAIVTDHAPHCPGGEGRFPARAPNGIVGLETSFAAGLHRCWWHQQGMGLTGACQADERQPRQTSCACRAATLQGGRRRRTWCCLTRRSAGPGRSRRTSCTARAKTPRLIGTEIDRTGGLHHPWRQGHLAAQKVSGHALACNHTIQTEWRRRTMSVETTDLKESRRLQNPSVVGLDPLARLHLRSTSRRKSSPQYGDTFECGSCRQSSAYNKEHHRRHLRYRPGGQAPVQLTMSCTAGRA